jgi:ferredoxin
MPPRIPHIVVNRVTCVGFAVCRTEAPATFELVDGKSTVVDPGGDPLERVLSAARRCPTESIEVQDADGRRLAPP